MRTRVWVAACLVVMLAGAGMVSAQGSRLIEYRGRVAVGGEGFEGTGKFRFALVGGVAGETYWSNDGSSVAGSEPADAVEIEVKKGLYAVLLGDAGMANMEAVPASAFENADVRLRVWFDDGVNGSQLLSPDQRIGAVGYAMRADGVMDGAVRGAAIAGGAVGNGQWGADAVTAAKVAVGAVTSGHLARGAVETNLNASGFALVPGGAVVLSEAENPALVEAGYVNLGLMATGGAWEERSSLAGPAARQRHTAVWTGSELIVWGGGDGSVLRRDGGRFNPVVNRWTALSVSGAPAARSGHTAVWTGSEMIVWGGTDGSGYFADGGRYNPVTDSWMAVSGGGGAARSGHTAVWTGNEMIVWGGVGSGGLPVSGGWRMRPASGTWAAMTGVGAPGVRLDHTVVWTGEMMIVWGGRTAGGAALGDGARYLAADDYWMAASSFGAPGGRSRHTAVWTGSEMIVWGGAGGSSDFSDGGRYNPTSNSWMGVRPDGAAAVTVVGAPTARSLHVAVWTGREMMIWGGVSGGGYWSDGGRYNPTENSWIGVPTLGAPLARESAPLVWTGREAIIFGGTSGGTRYYGDTWSWRPGKPMYLYQKL